MVNDRSRLPVLIRRKRTVWAILFVLVLILGRGISIASDDDRWDMRFNNCFDGGEWFDGDVRCLLVENGALFAGGDFLHAGGTEVNHIAYWNGLVFEPLDSGLSDPVHAIALGGNLLYAGGSFSHAGGLEVNHIAAWNGWEWSVLGAGFDATVCAVAVSGDEIYAGGEFRTAGGDSASYIARWDGSGWSPLGTGMDGKVNVIAVHNGDIYAGGQFTTAGGVTVNGIAKWDGSEWYSLSDGVAGGDVGPDMATVYAISFDEIGDCYVGGNFTAADGIPVNFIARWDGSGWNALDCGLDERVFAIEICDEGLIAGGSFLTDGLVMMPRIGLWDGVRWHSMGNETGASGDVLALAEYGDEVYLAGKFNIVNPYHSVGKIAKWRDYRFYTFANSNNSPNDVVTSLIVRDGNLIAGGSIVDPGCTVGRFLAFWNGDRWQVFGEGPSGGVRAMAADDDYLYVGGNFMEAGGSLANNIARWNGSEWNSVGNGIRNWIVYALVMDGSDLYVGGEFDEAGFVTANNVARWDGWCWYAVGSGTDGPVFAVTVMGGDLYAGGSFSAAGGVAADNIARWDGSAWHPVSGGTAGPVFALASEGSDLYVGGTFRSAGSVMADYIAKWDGSGWSALGSVWPGWKGVNGTVRAIALCGGDLYAGGEFTVAGSDTVNRIAVLNGGQWQPLGSGVSEYGNINWPLGVLAIACHDDGIYAGGNFFKAGGKSSQYLGLYHTALAGADDIDVPAPRLSLLKSYPNPFNPHTKITYEIHRRTEVNLSIYNVSGGLVATLVNEVQEPRPGGYSVAWNGLDGKGRKVSSGVYLCRLKTDHHDESTKLVLLK